MPAILRTAVFHMPLLSLKSSSWVLVFPAPFLPYQSSTSTTTSAGKGLGRGQVGFWGGVYVHKHHSVHTLAPADALR